MSFICPSCGTLVVAGSCGTCAHRKRIEEEVAEGVRQQESVELRRRSKEAAAHVVETLETMANYRFRAMRVGLDRVFLDLLRRTIGEGAHLQWQESDRYSIQAIYQMADKFIPAFAEILEEREQQFAKVLRAIDPILENLALDEDVEISFIENTEHGQQEIRETLSSDENIALRSKKLKAFLLRADARGDEIGILFSKTMRALVDAFKSSSFLGDDPSQPLAEREDKSRQRMYTATLYAFYTAAKSLRIAD